MANDKCPDCGAELTPDHSGLDAKRALYSRWVKGGAIHSYVHCLTRQNAHLREQVKRLRGRLCIHCRSGDVPVNGRHCVESLSECEPNQFTDKRSGVKDYIICPAERDAPGGLRRMMADECKPKTGSSREALHAIWEAGGKAWDDIEDPEAYIREMRGSGECKENTDDDQGK